MDNRDMSILVQVAFKGAIEAAGDQIGSDIGNAAFIETFGFLADALITEVTARQGGTITSGPQAASPVQQIQQAFPGAGPMNQVEVITTKFGGQQGPLPDWLFHQAAAKGVTKVFDNRANLQRNPKSPWFKAPKDQGDHAFWPPKEVVAAGNYGR